MSCFNNTLTMLDRLENVFESAQDELVAVDAVVEGTVNIADTLEILANMFGTMVQAMAAMLMALAGILRAVPGKSPLNTALRAVGTALRSIARRALKLARQVSRRVMNKAERVRRKFLAAVQRVANIIGEISSAMEAAEEMVSVLRALIELLSRQPRICELVGDEIAAIDATFVNPANRVLTEVQLKLDEIKAKRQQVNDKYAELIAKFSQFSEIQSNLAPTLAGLALKVSQADEFVNETKASVQPYIDEATETIRDIPIVNVLFDAAVTLIDTVEGWVQDIVNGLDFLFGREISESMAEAMAEAESAINEITVLVDEIEKMAEELADIVKPLLDQAQQVFDQLSSIFESYTGIRLEKLITERDLPAFLREALERLEKFKKALERLQEEEEASNQRGAIQEAGAESVSILQKISNQISILKPSDNRQIFGYPVFEKLKFSVPYISEATEALNKAVNKAVSPRVVWEKAEALAQHYRGLDAVVAAFNADNPRFTDSYFEQLQRFESVRKPLRVK